MSVTHKKLAEVEAYTGPHEISGIRFRHARKEFNVSSWGMNILELDPDCTGYPEHDHVKDGQEELYVVLQGAAILQVEGKEYRVSEGEAIRVAPDLKRKWITGKDSVRLLALGGTPGKAYEPGDM